MDNSPLPMLAAMIGMLLFLSIYARLMHKAARDKCKRAIKNISATAWWWFLKSAFYCAAIPCNLFNRICRSRLVSPNLYLPDEQFSGNLTDYLRAVAQHPVYAESVEQRLVRMIDRGGIDYRRTFEVRYKYRKHATVYNAFRNLTLVDCLALSALVDCLRHKRPGQIPTLVGPGPSGKTMTVHALAKLLERSEPVPLVQNEFGLRIHPLRMLTAIHAFARRRFPNMPHEVAVAEILDDLGFGTLLAQKRNDARLQELCKLADVSVSLQGIATLKQSYEFMAILHHLLGLRLTVENYHKVKRFELEILLQVCWMPQDAKVRGIPYQSENSIVLAQPRERWFDREIFYGSVNVAKLGRVPDNSPEAWNYDGVVHRSNCGMLVVDEALRYPSGTFTELSHTQLEQQAGVTMHWDGLLILVTGEQDLKQLVRSRFGQRLADNLQHIYFTEGRAFLDESLNRGNDNRQESRQHIYFTRCIDIGALERHLGEMVDNAVDQAEHYGRTLEVDPLVVPLMARLVAVSDLATAVPATEALDLIDPERGGLRLDGVARNQEGGISLRVAQHALQSLLMDARYNDNVTTVTREQVLSALSQMVSRRYVSGNDEQLLRAFEAVDAWMNQPHPVLHTVHRVKTTWRNRKKLLPRLKQWLREQEALS